MVVLQNLNAIHNIMAKLKSGILGGISGTVGNVVGGRWRGIDYIRSKPASVNNPNTEKQRIQRSRFKLVVQLLSKVKPLINVGFRNGRRNQTPMNSAVSLNIREAITGTYPYQEINPEALVVSVGELQGSSISGMDLTVPEAVTITWVNESGVGNASNLDAAMVLLYNKEKNAVIYNLHGASREDEALVVAIPASWNGDSVAGYLAFRSETDRDVSNSIFLGEDTAA